MTMTRREFLSISAAAACTLAISTALSGCGDSGSTDGGDSSSGITASATFEHGIASGDPLSDKVIIWTRVTPSVGSGQRNVVYEIAEDGAFSGIIRRGIVTTDAERDYTVKIDVQELAPDTVYYYRFSCGGIRSAVGRTKTLPEGSVASVKMAVFSCSNYPKGYFNAYAEAAKHGDLDVALHLGDYIYEYGMPK